MPIFLSNEDQERCLDGLEAVSAMRSAILQLSQGNAIRRPRTSSFIPLDDDKYFAFSSMEGGVRDPGYYAMRVKPDVVTFTTYAGKRRSETFTHRPGKYGGLVFLFDTQTAALLAILNDGFVQHMRVAATAALGVEFLSRQDSAVLGIVGSGWMARTFPLTISTVRKIDELRVYSPNREHVMAYCNYMEGRVPFRVLAAESPALAAKGADILCTCTTSLEPVIDPDDVHPGTHLNNVRPWELSSEVCAKVDVEGALVDRTPVSVAGFVDDDFAIRFHVMSYAAGSPEERERIPRGDPNPARFPNARKVNWSDSDFKRDRPYGRNDDHEITVLANCSYGIPEGDAGVSAGIQGIQFAAVAGRLYESAVTQGLGDELPLDLFLQDIPT